jgi:hypothetical protein
MVRIAIGILLLASYLLLGNNVKESPETITHTVKSTIWILGVTNHSGAVQYATLSPDLQEKTKIEFEKIGWQTGQSSPWLENIRIVKEEKMNQNTYRYTLEYDLVSPDWQWDKKGEKIITVEKNPERIKHWYITKILSNYNKYEAFTPGEKVTKILE